MNKYVFVNHSIVVGLCEMLAEEAIPFSFYIENDEFVIETKVPDKSFKDNQYSSYWNFVNRHLVR